MNIEYLLRLLRTHMRFIAWVTVTACAVGLLATYILSEKFEASITIFLRPHEEVEFAPTSKVVGDYPVSYSVPVETMPTTYAQMLRGEATAARVVKLLKLDTLKAPPHPDWWVRLWRGLKQYIKRAVVQTWMILRYGRLESQDPYFEAIEDVMDAIEAQSVQETYLFSLTVTWNDPELATLIAKTVADVFVEMISDTRKSAGGSSASFLEKSVESQRQALEQARHQLADFKAREKLASRSEQLSLRLAKLVDFQTERDSTVKELEELGARRIALDRQLSAQPKTIHSQTTTARNPVIGQLEAELAGKQVELAAFQDTYSGASPKVAFLQAQIDEIARRIDQEEGQVRSRDSRVSNPIRVAIKTSRLALDPSIAALEARLSALDETIAEYQNMVDQLSGQESELARLSLEVEVREEEFRLVHRKFAEARFAALQEISEIRVLGEAIPPVYPTKPIKIYYAGGGALAGLLIAVALVLIVDYVDPRVRGSYEVEQLLRAPVVTTIPRLSGAPGGVAPGGAGSEFTWRIFDDGGV